MAAVSYKVVISGLVQGVAFRACMRDEALRHGVKGWVRNRDDGAVEALMQGEEANVARLLDSRMAFALPWALHQSMAI